MSHIKWCAFQLKTRRECIQTFTIRIHLADIHLCPCKVTNKSNWKQETLHHIASTQVSHEQKKMLVTHQRTNRSFKLIF